MKTLTCIVCPRGCRLEIEEQENALHVRGHSCPRGEAFAKSELTHPMRSLTTTVRTSFSFLPYLPVRTKGEIGKEEMGKVLRSLRNYTLDKEVHCGETIIEDIAGTGCDIIATLDCKYYGRSGKGDSYGSSRLDL